MKRFGVIAAVVAVAGVVGYFTVSGEDVADFNDELVDIAREMDLSYSTYVSQLDTYAQGQKVDLAVMEKGLAEVDKAVSNSLEKIRKLEAPDDELCRKFRTSVLAYVEHGKKFVQAYREVSAYIKDHNPGNDADIEHVDSLLAELVEQDDALFDGVAKKQKEMAEEYSLKLE